MKWYKENATKNTKYHTKNISNQSPVKSDCDDFYTFAQNWYKKKTWLKNINLT